jgi:hypothetical protein
MLQRGDFEGVERTTIRLRRLTDLEFTLER